jgi:2-aminobenzoate-CoA ligase
VACTFTDHRPPVELWPERVYTLPEFEYDARINLASTLLDAHVQGGRGDRVAVVHGDRRITYAQLQRTVNRIGNGLRAQGVKPGGRVLLRMLNRPEFVATWLAVQKIGGVCVSTMPMLRARELAYVIRDSEACLAVVAEELSSEMDQAVEASATPPIVVTVAEDETRSGAGLTLDALMMTGAETLEAHPLDRDDVAIIAYTSGSTGQPKGACHAPIDILASADTYARQVLGASADDVFGGHPTLAFTYGLGAGLVFPMRVGAATVLLDRFSPEALLDATARHGVTLLWCGATTYKMLLQIDDLEQRFDLSKLRLCVSAGEPLPRSVHDEWIRRTGVEVLDGLGTTEMFHIFVSARPGDRRSGSTGRAVPGYDVRIVDEQLREVPRGTPGLLAVKGPTGCRYWRKPEHQRDYVRDGWNIPNDICLQDEDGFIWYQCRNDDLIISAGYNIAGPEVEAVLIEHPAVLEAAVVAAPDAVKGHVPKAFVVVKPSATPGPDLAHNLQEHAKRELAPYKYPRKVEFVDALPKTETGKIRRVELRKREAGG